MCIFKKCIHKLGSIYVWIDNKSLRKKFESLISEINRNSSLPCSFLEEETEDIVKLFGDVDYIDNYMSNDYYAENFEVSFLGYPTDEHSYKATEIFFSSPKYNIINITVGMKFDEALKILNNYGFKRFSDKKQTIFPQCDKYISFENMDMKIELKIKNNVITEISGKIYTYYLGNLIY